MSMDYKIGTLYSTVVNVFNTVNSSNSVRVYTFNLLCHYASAWGRVTNVIVVVDVKPFPLSTFGDNVFFNMNVG